MENQVGVWQKTGREVAAGLVGTGSRLSKRWMLGGGDRKWSAGRVEKGAGRMQRKRRFRGQIRKSRLLPRGSKWEVLPPQVGSPTSAGQALMQLVSGSLAQGEASGRQLPDDLQGPRGAAHPDSLPLLPTLQHRQPIHLQRLLHGQGGG